MTSGAPELDPRWDWVEVTVAEGGWSRWVRAGCRHLMVVPVESVTGAVVARLCVTCDSQLPPSGNYGNG